MGGFVFFLIVMAVLLAGSLGKKQMTGASRRRNPMGSPTGFDEVRRQLLALKDQQRQSGRRFPVPRVSTNLPPPPPQGWSAASSWTRSAGVSRQPVTAQTVAAPAAPAAPVVPPPVQVAPAEPATPVIGDLLDDPAIRRFLPDPTAETRAAADLRETRPDPAPPERYVGSAALESTLDSTIESSLMGLPAGPTTQSVVAAGQPVDLPQGVEARVLAFLAAGHEVAAVRLICDEMDCGILDAMRTVNQLS